MVSGCVKWFNSRHKYGFITVTSDGEYKNVDLFVHQSNINTKEPCYRFLIAGENVKFEVKITTDEKHPSQAVNVTEVSGGILKCEMPKQSYQTNEYTNDMRFEGGRGGRGGRGRGGSGGGRGGSGGSGGGRGGRGGSQGTFNRQGTFNGRGGGNFRSKEWSRCDNCENSNGDKDITHTSSSVNTTTD